MIIGLALRSDADEISLQNKNRGSGQRSHVERNRLFLFSFMDSDYFLYNYRVKERKYLSEKIYSAWEGMICHYCPACDEPHCVPVNSGDGSWHWNEDPDFPSLSPSIVINKQKGAVCHYQIKDGIIQYHAGKTESIFEGMNILLPEMPEYIRRPH